MRTVTAFLCALLIGCLVHARPALADTTATSTVTQMTVISKSNKKYPLYHGAIWLAHDEARTNYRWGGNHCGGKELSEAKVGMLFAAFRARYSVNIDFASNLYKGKRYRCITGFTVRRS